MTIIRKNVSDFAAKFVPRYLGKHKFLRKDRKISDWELRCLVAVAVAEMVQEGILQYVDDPADP